MGRLSQYLLRLFSVEAMALFGVAAFLLYLIQCLLLFDLVAVRGQGLFTLLGQAALGMPSLGIVVLYVCLGIGLGRALRGLQARSELQIIHVGALVPVLVRSVVVYALGGSVVLLLLAHVIDPASSRTVRNWSESIAADLVSRSMIPHRFTEVADGVTMIIGSRNAQGEITDFFADDTRNEAMRRTYFARSALITRDEQGFVLRMRDGAIQQFGNAQQMSQISFARYDLALDQLTGDTERGDGLAQVSSLELIGEALRSGAFSAETSRLLMQRSIESLRVLAMCLLVAGIAAFPSGNRQRGAIPIEIVVLGAAFLERGLTTYVTLPGPVGQMGGPLLMLGVGLVILAVRLRVFSPVRLRRRPA